VVSLLIAGVALVVSLRSRRSEPGIAPPQPEPDPALSSEPGTDPSWDHRVLDFILALRGAVSSDQLRDIIARQLPPLLGVEHLWMVTRFGRDRQLVVPQRQDRQHPVFGGGGDWSTFPMTVQQKVVGVLGVDISRGRLSPGAQRAMSALVPLIAESLYTAYTIEQLREVSSVDPITGCATRRSGLQRLKAELKRAHRSSRDVAVLMLDLDYFKSINDRFGHSAGDAVLTSVGRTILQTLRISDLRCRWGGEEFLVALPETSLEQAKQVASALAKRIAATATTFNGAKIRTTTSIGVTIADGDDDPAVVVARADAALYRAKADGRNCIRITLPERQPAGPIHEHPDRASGDRREPPVSDRRHATNPGRRKTDRTSPRTTERGDVS
jgi:diguanylate cyclase (GGDEF)-like protein